MARKALIRSDQLPYHITVRSNNREWFYLSKVQVWNIFQRNLFKIQALYGIKVHAFVLMDNHIHLVLTTPFGNIDIVMRYFLRESCRSINDTAKRINHVFGGPYKWSLIGDSEHYKHVIKYVYRNPVKAGICDRVEQYDFTSLHQEKSMVSIVPSIFSEGQQNIIDLDWLNSPYNEEEDDCLRRAIRRKVFRFTPDRKTRILPALFQTCAK